MESKEKAVDDAGQISVPLEGIDYVLRPSYKAISNIERRLNMTLFEMSAASASGRLNGSQLAVIVEEMMHAYGQANPDCEHITTYKGAKAEALEPLIFSTGIARVLGRIAVILSMAITGGYTAEGELKATE